jgi:hypothetical protein
VFWRRRPKTPAEPANDAEIEKLAREATVGELERGVGRRGSWLGPARLPWRIVPFRGGGELKLQADKEYDADESSR